MTNRFKIAPVFILALVAPGVFAQNPPKPEFVRNPTLYEVDTQDLSERIVDKLEKASSREVLRWAVTQVGNLGESAIPGLRRAFYRNFSRLENYPALSNICEALGMTNSPKAVPLLIDALSHPSGIVRTKAVDSLVVLRSPESFQYLKSLLAFESKEYRVKLFKSLAATESPEFINFAREVWQNDQIAEPLKDQVIQSTIENFYSDEAQAFLFECFQKPRIPTSQKALISLGLAKYGDADAIKYCEQIANGEIYNEKLFGVVALGYPLKTNLLEGYASDPNIGVRIAVVRALTWGLKHPPNQKPDGDVTQKRSLGMDLLKKLAQDSVSSVRLDAIRALVELGDRSAMDPYLVILRNEPQPDAMKEALDLIMDPKIQETRAIPILIDRLEKDGIAVKRTMMQGLGALHDARGVDPMIKILTMPPQDMGVASSDEFAAMQLSFLGKPAIRPLIELDKKTTDPRIHRWILQTLAWSRDPEAGDYLVDRIEDLKETRENRLFLTRQLTLFTRLELAGRLKRLLHKEPDMEIRTLLNDTLWDYF